MSSESKISKNDKLKQLIALPKNKSDWEFTSVLISRPIGYLILKTIGDLRFLTPNFITIIGFISFLTASALIFRGFYIPAVLFLFLRLIFDDLDGMTARYKGKSSFFGSYLDKITDVFGFFVYFLVLGFVTYKKRNSLFPVYASFSAVFALLVTGYVKWVVASMKTESGKNRATSENIEQSEKPGLLSSLGLLILKLAVVNECDIFLFSMILIPAGKIEWLLALITVSQLLQMFAMVVKRGIEAYKADKYDI